MEQEKFKPTVEWMAAKYDQFNRELFGGTLGSCDFDIFTTGKGSYGNVLGWFSVTAKGLRINRHTRGIYDSATHIYVTHETFVKMCKPLIRLNANYSWTEDAMEATLVHEMCHYYNYMDGYCPKQGHGPEFRAIAAKVSRISNGRFSVQRVASAEQMRNMELDAHIAAANKRRLDNKKSKMTAVVVYRDNGDIELTLATSPQVVNSAISHNKKIYQSVHRGERVWGVRVPVKILTSNDPQLIDMLVSNGYKRAFRTYRYWNIQQKPWANSLESMYNMKEELRESKGKRNLSMIIEDVIDRFVNREDEEDISITPDMNLGVMSPLEVNN